MTAFLLIRHGAHGRLGKHLDGRRPGVHLSVEGRAEVARLARQVAERYAGRAGAGRLSAVHASPLERAQETAAPIAAALGLEVVTDPSLIEIDFGEWSGRTFEELEPLDAWRRWNAARSTARTPAGDTMRAAQARILDAMDALRLAHPEGTIALVSHADPIKAALAYALGLSLDDLSRIEVAPASVSRVVIEPWDTRVTLLNETSPQETRQP